MRVHLAFVQELGGLRCLMHSLVCMLVVLSCCLRVMCRSFVLFACAFLGLLCLVFLVFWRLLFSGCVWVLSYIAVSDAWPLNNLPFASEPQIAACRATQRERQREREIEREREREREGSVLKAL